MKFSAFFLMFMLSSLAQGQEVSKPALGEVGLQRVNTIDQTRLDFRFQNRATFSISKEKFRTHAEAAAFCRRLGLEMADESAIAVLGIFGYESSTDVIDALTFSFETQAGVEVSGVIGWRPQTETVDGKIQDMFAMVDGQGSAVQYGDIETFRKVSAIQSIAAICTDLDTNSEGLEVDNSDRGSNPEGGPAQVPPSQRPGSSTSRE
jgi:hypothetical protein